MNFGVFFCECGSCRLNMIRCSAATGGWLFVTVTACVSPQTKWLLPFLTTMTYISHTSSFSTCLVSHLFYYLFFPPSRISPPLLHAAHRQIRVRLCTYRRVWLRVMHFKWGRKCQHGPWRQNGGCKALDGNAEVCVHNGNASIVSHLIRKREIIIRNADYRWGCTDVN